MRTMSRNRSMTVVLALAAIGLPALPAGAQSPDLEANKRVAVEFYEAAINEKDFDKAASYLGSRYIQHNPSAPDGAEGLRSFIDFLKANHPNQRGDIKRVVAEDDLVVLHVHSTRDDGTPGRAIVDIYRIEDGKVVEHWDVIQDIPEEAANSNGMF